MRFVYFALIFAVAVSLARWELTIGGESSEVALDVRQTPDGGYIACGWTESFESSNRNIWVVRTDEHGDTLWTKIIGTGNYEWGTCIIPLPDGTYILGANQRRGSANDNAWIMRLDEYGDSLWQGRFGSDDIDVIQDGELDNDGNVVFAGTANARGGAFGDIWLIKLSIHGDSIFVRTPGSADINNGYSVEVTRMGLYLITGSSKPARDAPTSAYLVMTDNFGEFLWDRTYPGMSSSHGVKEFLDGRILLAGEAFHGGSAHIATMVLNSSGDPIGDVINLPIGDNSTALACVTDGFGNIVLAGFAFFFDARMENIIIAKLDADGDEIWIRDYGANNTDKAHSIRRTGANSYIVAGEKAGAGRNSDFLLMKLDSLGYSPVEEAKNIPAELGLTVYPNPFNSSCRIDYTSTGDDIHIKIVDIYGRAVAYYENLTENGYIKWDAEHLRSGVYIANLISGDKVYSKKIVLCK